MLTEQDIRREARLVALENVVMTLLAAIAGTPERMSAISSGMLGKMRQETFPGIDPTLSDMMAAEIEAAHEELLSGAAEKVAERKGG